MLIDSNTKHHSIEQKRKQTSSFKVKENLEPVPDSLTVLPCLLRHIVTCTGFLTNKE